MSVMITERQVRVSTPAGRNICRHAVRICICLTQLVVPPAALGQTVSITAQAIYDRRANWAGEESSVWCAHPTKSQTIFGFTQVPQDPLSPGNYITSTGLIKVSVDGAKSWKVASEVNRGRVEIDPTCAYGPNGYAYLGTMRQYDIRGEGLFVRRSTDGGRTWSSPLDIDYPRWIDRPSLAVDSTSLNSRGRVYIAGWSRSTQPEQLQRPDEIVVFASDDDGQSFTGPTTVPTETGTAPAGSPQDAVYMGETAVLPDGSYGMSWTEVGTKTTWASALPRTDGPPPDQRLQPDDTRVKFVRSLDGGRTFRAPVVVWKGKGKVEVGGRELFVGKLYPTLDVDKGSGPLRGNVYMVWSDASAGRLTLLFSKSADGGSTWTAPRTISGGHAYDGSSPGSGPHSVMPTLRVNKNGAIGIFYYAQDPTASVGPVFWPTFIASTDGGVSWSAPHRVTSKPLDADHFEGKFTIIRRAGFPVPATFYFSAGKRVPSCHYGLTVDAAGDFRIFPFTNPDGEPQYGSYTAKVGGPTVRRVVSTKETRLDILKYEYLQEKKTLSVDIVITNTSKREIILPVRVAVDSLVESSTRRVDVLNADNGWTTAGAWWEFNSDVTKILKPGESTGPRTLRFNFTGSNEGSLSEAPALTYALHTFVVSAGDSAD